MEEKINIYLKKHIDLYRKQLQQGTVTNTPLFVEDQLAFAEMISNQISEWEEDKPKEYILCAAIWYKEIPLKKNIEEVLPKNCNKGLVVLGHRHTQCMWTMGCLTGFRSVTNAPDAAGEYEQGFLTNTNRFVNRKEAAEIAFNSNQITNQKNELYSEDLY
jgi:hypothetical protein